MNDHQTETTNVVLASGTTLQFSRTVDAEGNPLCTCGSGVVWSQCPGVLNPGYCG